MKSSAMNSNKQVIDIQGWSQGLYLIRITNNEGHLLKAERIIIE